jgi:hypothetical protein
VGVSRRTRQPFRNIGDTVTMMILCRLFNHQILRQYCLLAKRRNKGQAWEAWILSHFELYVPWYELHPDHQHLNALRGLLASSPDLVSPESGPSSECCVCIAWPDGCNGSWGPHHPFVCQAVTYPEDNLSQTLSAFSPCYLTQQVVNKRYDKLSWSNPGFRLAIWSTLRIV